MGRVGAAPTQARGPTLRRRCTGGELGVRVISRPAGRPGAELRSASVPASVQTLRLQAIEPHEAPPRGTHNSAYVGFVWHDPSVSDGVPNRVKPLDVIEKWLVFCAKRPPNCGEHELVEQPLCGGGGPSTPLVLSWTHQLPSRRPAAPWLRSA